MKILFLHGWASVPGGRKPSYLKDAGGVGSGDLQGDLIEENKTSNYGDAMEQRTVRSLERKLEEAVAEVIVGMGKETGLGLGCAKSYQIRDKGNWLPYPPFVPR